MTIPDFCQGLKADAPTRPMTLVNENVQIEEVVIEQPQPIEMKDVQQDPPRAAAAGHQNFALAEESEDD